MHTRWIPILACAVVLGACWTPGARAETRRALLVGIDRYRPEDAMSKGGPVVHAGATRVAHGAPAAPAGRGGRGGEGRSGEIFADLHGAVNDIEALRQILVSRYDFRPEDIVVLEDTLATRDRILRTFRKRLIEDAVPGDVCFFAYAGHGSQVRNSLSTELDKKDETLVPADANRGVWDIRDKELRRLYNDVLDRGAHLTIYFDSCHSGSISRGLAPHAFRSIAEDPRDVALVLGPDPPDPRPDPAERGALVLSAAQEDQKAAEVTGPDHQMHGAFSLALLQVLRSAPRYAPTSEIFARTKAMMQANGEMQEPAEDATPERKALPLFDAQAGGRGGRTIVAVLKVDDEGDVELQAGRAVGLAPGCELVKSGPADAQSVRVRVKSVESLASATGEVIAGSRDSLASGDLLYLDRWVAPDDAFLRVWLPPSGTAAQRPAALAAECAALRASSAARWVEDPAETPPTHVVRFGGAGWSLVAAGHSEPLGATLRAATVLAKLRPAAGARPALYVELPPAPGIAAELGLGAGGRSSSGRSDAIEAVKSPGEADYLLAGRFHGAQIEYAWVRPEAGLERPGHEAFPARTDWIAADPESTLSLTQAGLKLRDLALSLGRVRGWLTMETPPDEGYFPYRLAFRDSAGGQLTDGPLLVGRRYQMVMRADPSQLSPPPERRFVYVFAIDTYGKSVLLFPPRSVGNVGNLLPIYDADPDSVSAEAKVPTEIPIARPVRIKEPVGLDTYFVLASKEAIPDPSVLAYTGVRTRGGSDIRGAGGGLARLLARVSAATRGAGEDEAVPTDWTLLRRSVRSALAP